VDSAAAAAGGGVGNEGSLEKGGSIDKVVSRERLAVRGQAGDGEGRATGGEAIHNGQSLDDAVQLGIDHVQVGVGGEGGGEFQTLKLNNARSGVLVAVLAALSVNLGKVCQKRGTQDLPSLSLKASVLKSYFSNGWWVVGVMLDVSGALMTMLSLSLAPVSVVQPVLGCGLVFVALFSVFAPPILRNSARTQREGHFWPLLFWFKLYKRCAFNRESPGTPGKVKTRAKECTAAKGRTNKTEQNKTKGN